jgi:hypothetical protein
MDQFRQLGDVAGNPPAGFLAPGWINIEARKVDFTAMNHR